MIKRRNLFDVTPVHLWNRPVVAFQSLFTSRDDRGTSRSGELAITYKIILITTTDKNSFLIGSFPSMCHQCD